MKVLFVSSSRGGKGISPFIKSQMDSLRNIGVQIDEFTILGSGLKNYLKSIFTLRKKLITNSYQITHAHYNLTAIVCLFAKIGLENKLVVSFMGDDLYGTYTKNNKLTLFGYVNILFSKICIQYYDFIIVKSNRMKNLINLKHYHKVSVLPNGVDFEIFKPINQIKAKEMLGLSTHDKHVLFLNDLKDPRKNYELFKQAIDLIDDEIVILTPYPIEQSKVPIYLNAADALVHCSKMEGSSNLIKEAIACNCPIIATDVGDARENLESIEGCYIVDFNPKKIAININKIIKSGTRTNGRDQILHLKTDIIANKINSVYKQIMN